MDKGQSLSLHVVWLLERSGKYCKKTFVRPSFCFHGVVLHIFDVEDESAILLEFLQVSIEGNALKK